MENPTARIGLGAFVTLLLLSGLASALVAPVCPDTNRHVCIFSGISLEPVKAGPSGKDFSTSGFSCPVNAPVTGSLGGSYTNLNGEQRRREGVEIRLPEGTDVHAAAGGIVTISKTDLLKYGRFVTIRHAENPNVETTYGFLQPGSNIKAEQDKVNKGDVIGKSGTAGPNQFPSLYFELRRGGLPQRDVETICKSAPTAVTPVQTAALPQTGVCQFKSPIPGSYKSQIGSPAGQLRPTQDGGYRYHKGDDLEVVSGTVASAACSGKVTYSGAEDVRGYGGEVVVLCDCQLNGKAIYTRYGHMKQRDVKTGERVNAGQRVGLTGGLETDPDPGSSHGAHLHFELRTGGELGAFLLPKNYIS